MSRLSFDCSRSLIVSLSTYESLLFEIKVIEKTNQFFITLTTSFHVVRSHKKVLEKVLEIE